MSLPIVIHDDAVIEVEEAAIYYEERRPGLGLEFVAAIDRIVLDIGENSERFPAWRQSWRRGLLRRFPFVVFFEIEEDRVSVLAVAHAKRHPGYWVARRPPLRVP